MNGNIGCLHFTTIKKGLDIKNTPGYMQYADAKKKSHFYKKRPKLVFIRLRTLFFLWIYFLQDFNSCDLISSDFIGSLHPILVKVLGI